MAFGAKINLTPNTAGKVKFRNEIQKFANEATQGNPIKIRNLAFEISDPVNQLSSVQKQLNDAGGISVKIKEVDASGAIKKLRSDIQEMLSGLNIVGLKEFLGSGDTEKIANDIDKAKQSTSQWASQLKTIQAKLNSVYSSGLSGDKMIQNESQMNEITDLYSTWQDKVQSLKDAKASLSAEEIRSLQNEGIAIQRKITLIQEEEKANLKASKTEEINARKNISLAQQQASLKSQIQRYILSNSRAHKAFGDELDGLMLRLSSGSELTEEDLKEVRRQLTEIQIAARDAGLSGNTFFTTMKKGFEKFGGWSLVTRSLTAVYKIFKDMISAVKDLDSAMTELKKVTDETDSTYEHFLNNATNRAQKVGADLVDIVKATSDYARLGYDLSDAEDLADASIIYKNVGDGINDINEASESIISTMQAFGVAAQDSMSIVDKFNEVGNNFAISSKGIGDALLNSASAMSAANNTLDETIGLITAANTVIQDPEKVGTALKTVSMYLRAAKTEAEDAGESTEGMAASVSELRNELLSLTGNKVDIQIDDNTFKSTYEILGELSKVWSNLSDISQANILELIGGKRNSNVVSALLNNFEIAEDALATSMESANSAIEENEKQLESIEGRVTLLKAQFQELAEVTIDSDFIKSLVDAGTTLLKIVQFLTESKALFVSIAGIVAAINVNKIGVFVTNIISNIKSFSIKKAFDDYSTGISAAILKLAGFKIETEAAALATKSLQASMLAITAVITIATLAYQKHKQSVEETEENAKKAAEARKSAVQEETKEIENLRDLQSQYAEIVANMQGSAFNDEELTTVRGIQEQINSLLEDQKEKVDLINGSYNEQLKLLSGISAEKAKDLLADANTAVYSSGQDFVKTANDYKGELDWGSFLSLSGDSSSRFEEINNTAIKWLNVYAPELIQSYQSVLSAIGGSGIADKTGIRVSGFEDTEEGAKRLVNTYETLTKLRGYLIGTYGEENTELLSSSDLYQQLQAVIGNLQDGYNEYAEAVGSQTSIQAAIKFHDELSKATVESSADYVSFTKHIRDTYGSNSELCDSLLELAKVYFPQFANSVKASEQNIEDFANSTTNALTSLNNISKGMGMLDGIYKDILDGEDFDYSSLISDEFKTVFSSLGESYENFIKTIANSPNDISACRSAFDDLTTAYFRNSNVLKGLNEETRDVTVSYLEQMGVANAASLVDAQLRYEKEKAKYTTGELTAEIYEEIAAEYEETAASSAAERALLELMLAKVHLNENKIDTADEIKAILSLANSAGVGVQAIGKLAQAYDVLNQVQAGTGLGMQYLNSGAYKEAKATIDAINNGTFDFKFQTINPEDIIVDYSGGTNSKNYISSTSEKKAVEEYIAEIDRLYNAKQRVLEVQEKINNVENQINITDDLKSQVKLHEQLVSLYNDEISAQTNLNSQRDKIIQENIKKLKSSGFNITYDPTNDDLYIKNQEHINDLKGKDAEATNKLRKEYEELIKDTISLNDENKDVIDNINSLTESIKSTTEQVKKLRDEIYQSDIDNIKFELSIAENDEAKGEYLLSYWTSIIKRVNNEIEYYLSQGYDITSGTIQSLMNDLWEAEDEFETIVQEGYEKIQSALDNLSSYYQTLTDAADEFASAGFITIDTLESILGFGAEYMKYLLDETGAVNFNREAIEKLIAAKVRNYTISQAQAFLDEVKKNEDNAEALRNLADATYDANDASLLYLYTQINALNVSEDLKNRYKEIIDSIITMGEAAVDSIGHTVGEVENKLSEQQDALNTIIDLTKDYIKQQAQDEIDTLNEQIDKYNEIVDLKKEQLSLAKEEAEYEKEVSNSVKSIAEIQAEIDQLALDDSVEAQSKRSELIDQLNEKQSELANKQDDYTYDNIISTLEDSKEAYNTIVQKQIDAINDSISSEQKLYNAAIELLELDWAGAMENLKEYNFNMGSLLSKDLEFTIKIATDSVTENGSIGNAINNTGANGSDPNINNDSTNNIIANGMKPSDAIENAGAFLEGVLGQFGNITGIFGSIFGGNKFIAGDVNGDGKVTAADARLAIRAAARLVKLTEDQIKAADIDGDGVVSSGDARTILRMAARLEKESIASMSVEDIAKSFWSAIEVGDNDVIRQYADMLSQKTGNKVYESENGEWYIMTPSGSKKVFDIYPKFHSGGIVGETSTLNDREVLAILERGEIVLDDAKKESVYEIIDFAETIGRILNIDALSAHTLGQSILSAQTLRGIESVISPNSSFAFAPNIEIHIDSFSGSEDDARRAANIIGKTAMDYMYEAFNKRGMSSLGSAFLKK